MENANLKLATRSQDATPRAIKLQFRLYIVDLSAFNFQRHFPRFAATGGVPPPLFNFPISIFRFPPFLWME